MGKTKWVKSDGYMTEAVANYQGVKIERTYGKAYYFHWTTNIYWAAPHSHMSMPYRSLQAVKRAIDSMLACECATAEESLQLVRYEAQAQCAQTIHNLGRIAESARSCESVQYLCDKRISSIREYLNKAGA